MIRFLSGKLKKHTKLAKIVKISEIFDRLVFPLNFNRFCHPMTYFYMLILHFYGTVCTNVYALMYMNIPKYPNPSTSWSKSCCAWYIYIGPQPLKVSVEPSLDDAALFHYNPLLSIQVTFKTKPQQLYMKVLTNTVSYKSSYWWSIRATSAVLGRFWG